MDLERLEKMEQSIKNLEERTSRIYFLVQDTKGNPKAGIRHIYQIALTLKNNGFNPIIIHESKDYKGVGEWLGNEYMELPHQTIEGENLQISPEDLIVIPELYGHVMDQLKNFPCGKIVLCQAYDHMLEPMAPGTDWTTYGFYKCITTSEFQKNYITEVMRGVSIDVIQPLIPNEFSKKDKPSKPIISIHTRDPRDTSKIIKTFYLKYPQFRWVTFRDLRGINQNDFAKFLKESFVSVWVDVESGFGTFPLESMASGTPVIGKVPNLKPDWMTEMNGIWTHNTNEIVDILSNYLQNWLEDNISENLYVNMSETSKTYQNEEEFNGTILKLFGEYFDGRKTSFSDQIEKLKITEEN
jgi:hypothetical protein